MRPLIFTSSHLSACNWVRSSNAQCKLREFIQAVSKIWKTKRLTLASVWTSKQSNCHAVIIMLWKIYVQSYACACNWYIPGPSFRIGRSLGMRLWLQHFLLFYCVKCIYITSWLQRFTTPTLVCHEWTLITYTHVLALTRAHAHTHTHRQDVQIFSTTHTLFYPL